MSLSKKSLNALFEDQLRKYFEAHKGEIPTSGLYDRVVSEVERTLLRETLKATRGNQLKAAEVLGINRNTLRRKMLDLGLINPKNARRKS
jgi:two-component system nitrogen regulation response regulator GlnG